MRARLLSVYHSARMPAKVKKGISKKPAGRSVPAFPHISEKDEDGVRRRQLTDGCRVGHRNGADLEARVVKGANSDVRMVPTSTPDRGNHDHQATDQLNVKETS